MSFAHGAGERRTFSRRSTRSQYKSIAAGLPAGALALEAKSNTNASWGVSERSEPRERVRLHELCSWKRGSGARSPGGQPPTAAFVLGSGRGTKRELCGGSFGG